MIKQLKYYTIIAYSMFTRSTVVDIFGATYVVYGNVVQKVRV